MKMNNSRNNELEFFYVEKNPEEFVYVSMQCLGNKENEIEIELRNDELNEKVQESLHGSRCSENSMTLDWD